MSELTPRPKQIKRALAVGAAGGLVAGLATGGAVGFALGQSADAANRLSSPTPEATADAAPVSIEQQQFLDLIDKARQKLGTLPQVGPDITGPDNARLYEIGMSRVPDADTAINGSNIESALLESGKTANTASTAPYIMDVTETYAMYQVDLNGDGYNEYILSLKPSDPAPTTEPPTDLPPVSGSGDLIDSPRTH